MAAEIPPMKPDILIMESTYGTHLHEKREEREARFTGTIHDIINRGGRCLIPVFALGRAQELLLGIHCSFDDSNDENFDTEFMGQFDVINPHKAYS